MSIDGHAFIDLIKIATVDADALQYTTRKTASIHPTTLNYELDKLKQDIDRLSQGVSKRKSVVIHSKIRLPQLSLNKTSPLKETGKSYSPRDQNTSKLIYLNNPCTPLNISYIRKSYDLPEIRKQNNRQIGTKSFKKPKITRYCPSIIPKLYREDPFMNPAPLQKKDLDNGLLSLINKGVIPRDADLGPAFLRGLPPLQHRQMISLQFKNQSRIDETEYDESLHLSVDVGIGTEGIEETV